MKEYSIVGILSPPVAADTLSIEGIDRPPLDRRPLSHPSPEERAFCYPQGETMGKRKPGLPIERHVEIGKTLRKMQTDIANMTVEFANAYPRRCDKRGDVYRHLVKIDGLINEARSAAENNCAAEHPDKWTTKIYYGGNDGQSTN